MKRLIAILMLLTVFSCSKENLNSVERDLEIEAAKPVMVEDTIFGYSTEFMETMSGVQYTQNRDFSRVSNPKILVPIKPHIIRTDSGYSGFSDDDFYEALDEMNVKYADGNIEFYVCGGINYIDDTEIYSWVKTENQYDMVFDEQYNYVPTAINIYFANTVRSSQFGGSLCGYAYFPSGTYKNVVVMKNSCAENGSTLSHELGHTFALSHTHGNINGGTDSALTGELVIFDEQNAATTGDYIVDTPADPQLGQLNVSYSGEYTGNAVDNNGTSFETTSTFKVPLNNLMSYSRKNLRNEFTQDQLDRMYLVASTVRTDLECEDKPITTRPSDADCYVKSHLNYIVGTEGRNVRQSRQNPDNILGEPQEEEGNHFNFTTLGYGGEITADFEGAVPNEEGADFKIFETNHNGNTCEEWTEYANVSVSQDNENWSEKQLICTDDEEIDISDLGDYEWIRYVKIDTYNVPYNNNDGFDLDAIQSLHTCNPVVVPPSEENCYPNEVILYTKGQTKNGGNINPDRTDSSQALGEPEDIAWNNSLNEYFVTLGYNGTLVLKFQEPVYNESGNDLQIIETGGANSTCSSYPEYVDVYLSQNGINWEFNKRVCTDNPEIDIDDSNPNWFSAQYIKFNTDNVPRTTPDGYEVDGVINLNLNCN